MLKLRTELLEFVGRANSHGSLTELATDFSDVVDRQGFGSFIFTGLPAVGDNVEPLVIANHWPTEWVDRYREQAYFADDPVSKWSLSQTRPFQWKSAWNAHPNTRRVQQLNSEARSLGLANGIAFPMRALRNWQAVVSLATADNVEVDPAAEALLYTAAIYFQMAANDLAAADMPQRPRLTNREKEILLWISAGKSAWEISVILSLAESTVRNHLAAIHRKLDVASTTQAVVEAVRTGEIPV